jgi:hypothetical protein
MSVGAACGTVTLTMTATHPTGGCTSLITLPNSAAPSIQFTSSNSLTCTGIYSIAINAYFTTTPGPGTSVTSATTAYSYLNPCLTTSGSWNPAPSDMTVTVSSTSTTQKVSVIDLVSKTNGVPNTCGFYKYTISDVPA